MKKKMLAVSILLVVLPLIAQAARSGGGGSKSMNVQVREVIVRSTPDYLGAQTGKLTYGAPVNVTSESGNWFQIASPAGWVPKSAVTKHTAKVNPDQKYAAGSAKHDEVALAGKGFNPQVEAEYKRSNAELASAYAVVDRVETFDATEAELKTFQKAGKLR